MIFFPNCKINLGLHVVSKRNDGFHDIETIFYPIGWQDGLEIIENKGPEPIIFTHSGNFIEGNIEDNLVYKAWKLITSAREIPPIKVHLHKNIPMGAGLGGGSSNAAFFINLLDKKFELGISLGQKVEFASMLGSDCAFFIENKPVLAKGRGNIFSDINIDLKNYYFLVIYPQIHCNTKEAYQGLIPQKPQSDLRSIIENHHIREWKGLLVNDFETYVFKAHPKIKDLKQLLYNSGALYASLSGSGSAVFGIFEKKPEVKFDRSFNYFLQNPSSKLSYC